ncbi:hypothetical protein BBP40_002607 [Aspergillus hancockii]|nr:hypothetical protein BBP40_002607 [Aspergillus hancockii]
MLPASGLDFQVLYGLGLGMCFQVPNLAAQTVLPKPDVPIGLALMLFSQIIKVVVFIFMGEIILDDQLVQRLSNVPGFNPSLVSSEGVASLLRLVLAIQRDTVLTAYNEGLHKEGLHKVFQVGLIVSCLTAPGAMALEWRIFKKPPQPNT